MNKTHTALGNGRLIPQKKNVRGTIGTSPTARQQPSTSSASLQPNKSPITMTKFRPIVPKPDKIELVETTKQGLIKTGKPGIATTVKSGTLRILAGKHPASEDCVPDNNKKVKKVHLTTTHQRLSTRSEANNSSTSVEEEVYDDEVMIRSESDNDSIESDQPSTEENELSDYLSFKNSDTDKSVSTPLTAATSRIPQVKAMYSNLPKTHSPDYCYVKQNKNSVEHRVTPRFNNKNLDKSSDVLVPTNLNQYGECLKTRLGRYHYGLTLNDPPCLFFRGVLKGSTGQTLAVLFGDTNLISTLEALPVDEIGHFVIDNTFTVIPKSTAGVSRVLTINLLYQNQTIPLWYAVTSCSSTELYKRIIIEFQQHVLDWPFTSVLVNDDPALCSAVRAVFPDVDLHGSWYHYCYGIWKEIILYSLVEECKTNVTLMTAVKMLMVIPYLPPPSDHWPYFITMPEGLEVVRQYAEEHNLPEEFNLVLDYVSEFWFEKVHCKNFSVFGEQATSLNHVEIFQLSLMSFMKPDGNIWTLTRSFQNVAKVASFEVTRHFSGKPFSTRKKFNGKKFNVPIRTNMKKLLAQNLKVKDFLQLSTIYCDEVLDIFLHPLYPTTTKENTKWAHTEGWKIWTISKDKSQSYIE